MKARHVAILIDYEDGSRDYILSQGVGNVSLNMRSQLDEDTKIRNDIHLILNDAEWKRVQLTAKEVRNGAIPPRPRKS